MKLKMYEEAVISFTSAIHLDEAMVVEHIKKVKDYLALDEYQRSLVDEAQIKPIKPQYAIPYEYRGECYVALGKKDQALKDFNTAIDIDENYGEPYYQRAILKKDNNQKNDACLDLKKASNLGVTKSSDLFVDYFCWDSALGFYKDGLSKFNLGNYAGAISDLTIAMQLNPDSSNAFIKRGMCYYATQKFKEALADYNKALKKDSTNFMIHYQIGLCWYSLEQATKAFEEFAKSLAFNTGHYESYIYRAYCCEMLQNTSSAIFDYGSAIKIKPTNGLPYYKRALLKIELKDEKGGCADFKKAAELGEEDAQSYADGCK